MNKKERLVIVSSMRKFWDSANSHLDWVDEKVVNRSKGMGDRKFHAQTTVEYLEEMLKLAKTLV